MFGGGGAYIFLGRSPTNQSAPRTFLFRNCTFKNNTAHTEHYTFIYNLRSGYGRGGGLYMYISDGLKNVSISFIACKFISNCAFIGGGLSVNIQSKRGHETQNITVKTIDTLFQGNGYGGENNSDKHAGFGGGLHITFTRLDNIIVGGISDTSYYLQNVNFSSNYAELGGEVFFSCIVKNGKILVIQISCILIIVHSAQIKHTWDQLLPWSLIFFKSSQMDLSWFPNFLTVTFQEILFL